MRQKIGASPVNGVCRLSTVMQALVLSSIQLTHHLQVALAYLNRSTSSKAHTYMLQLVSSLQSLNWEEEVPEEHLCTALCQALALIAAQHCCWLPGAVGVLIHTILGFQGVPTTLPQLPSPQTLERQGLELAMEVRPRTPLLSPSSSSLAWPIDLAMHSHSIVVGHCAGAGSNSGGGAGGAATETIGGGGVRHILYNVLSISARERSMYSLCKCLQPHLNRL